MDRFSSIESVQLFLMHFASALGEGFRGKIFRDQHYTSAALSEMNCWHLHGAISRQSFAAA